MKNRMWIGCAVLAAAISGCGSSQERKVVVARSAQTTPPPPMQAHDDMCKTMMVDPATTQVSAEDTTDGIAIVFVSSGDPAALKERVQRMAEMHNKMATMHGEQGGNMGMKMVPSHATVEDMDNGARIVIVPDDPSQLEALRDRARSHAAMMARGECPMKGRMDTAHEHELEPSGT